MLYNMQKIFNMEGPFSIQVMLLGDKLCLIEDWVEGELKSLVKDGKQ